MDKSLLLYGLYIKTIILRFIGCLINLYYHLRLLQIIVFIWFSIFSHMGILIHYGTFTFSTKFITYAKVRCFNTLYAWTELMYLFKLITMCIVSDFRKDWSILNHIMLILFNLPLRFKLTLIWWLYLTYSNPFILLLKFSLEVATLNIARNLIWKLNFLTVINLLNSVRKPMCDFTLNQWIMMLISTTTILPIVYFSSYEWLPFKLVFKLNVQYLNLIL